MDLLALPPTKVNLKILLKKWMIPVNAIARSTGKKIINTGVNMVESPNPEKKVNMAVINAAKEVNKISKVVV